jgi:hypothetical protein
VTELEGWVLPLTRQFFCFGEEEILVGGSSFVSCQFFAQGGGCHQPWSRVGRRGRGETEPLLEETFRRLVYTLSGEANLLTEGAEWVALLGAGGVCWTSGGPLNPCGHGEGCPCRRWGEGGASSCDALSFRTAATNSVFDTPWTFSKCWLVSSSSPS